MEIKVPDGNFLIDQVEVPHVVGSLHVIVHIALAGRTESLDCVDLKTLVVFLIFKRNCKTNCFG